VSHPLPFDPFTLFPRRACGAGGSWGTGRSDSPRVLRGGSWNNDPDNCRAPNRNRNDPSNRNDNLGFRVASTPSAGVGGPGLE